MLSPIQNAIRKIHPEGIAWPFSVLYNAASGADIFQRHYELIAEDVLNYCSEGRVLDIGTGPGWLLKKMYQASSKFQITGLDISPSMVAKARQNMRNSGLSEVIDIKEGEAAKIPFAENTFDVVISTGSVHHWKEPVACLNDIYRVLKHGGYALMYDIVNDTPESVIKEAAHKFGKLKMFLLWLHVFEEPFYSHKNFDALVRSTLSDRDGLNSQGNVLFDS